MAQPNFEELARELEELAERCHAQIVDIKRDTAELRPLLGSSDVHRWVHIVHMTQAAGQASIAARLLREIDAIEPLAFATLARPAWEAATQLLWIHTDPSVLSMRWFDYTYFKAVIDKRGGKTQLVQEDLLYSLSGLVTTADPEYSLLRKLCKRHMTDDELQDATAGMGLLIDMDDLDERVWEAVTEEEFDAYAKQREDIELLRPLIRFLRTIQQRTGWDYPKSWTGTSARQMVEAIYVAAPSRYPTSEWTYPSWPFVWDPSRRQGDLRYREYQRLSEIAHTAGPMVLHTFGAAWSQYHAGAQLIKWASQRIADAVDDVYDASWQCTELFDTD